MPPIDSEDEARSDVRYPILRLAGNMYRWLSAGAGGAAFIGVVFGITTLRSNTVLGIFIAVSSLIIGVLAVITLFAASELLRWFIEVETNVRRLAQAVENLSWDLGRERRVAGIRRKFEEVLKKSQKDEEQSRPQEDMKGREYDSD